MNRIRNKKGFTMVELLVTLAITAILAAVVTLSLIAYTQYADFKRQNEYAQSLFVAAQNALTHYAENGELEAIADSAERYATPLTASMLEGEAAEAFDAKYEGRIYTITRNKNGTLNGQRPDSAAGQALAEILEQAFEPYVYDKSILDGASITLEFDPASGVVYSVLYSDKKSAFVYGADSGDAVSIRNRDRDERKKRMIGYYGIESISDLTSRNKEKPVIERVRLVNEEALRLSFRLTDKYAETATADLTYEIALYDSETRTQRMSFAIAGIPALYKTPEEKEAYDMLTVEAEVTTYNPDGSEAEMKPYRFIAYVDNTHTVHVLLDCVDLAALSETTDLTETYSFHRFGLDALYENLGTADADWTVTDNLYASVRGRGDRYKTSAWKRSNTENAYFASERNSSNATQYSAQYTISNARHLYNLRFEEAKDYGANSAITYTVASSFAWGGENGIFHGDLGSAVFTQGVETPERTEEGESTAFPVLPTLAYGHTLQTTRSTISGLVLVGGDKTGLIGENFGTISGLSLAEVSVSGGSAVGAFCGENTGALSALTTLSGTVRGVEDVGGIFGRNAVSGDVTYRDLTNGADVYGTKYVGGVTGRLEADDVSLSIEDCANTGLVLVNTEGEDPTGAIQDAVNGALEKADGPDVDSNTHNLAKPTNMFTAFLALNGGAYPALSDYDAAAIVRLIEETGMKGVNGYSGTLEEQVAALCAELVWVPCAAKDPNGAIEISGQRYTVVLAAKPKSISATSNWNSWVIYHDGAYYGKPHSSSNKLNAAAFTNKQIHISALDSMSGTEVSGGAYTPGGADEETGTFRNEPSYLGGIVGRVFAENGGSASVMDCTSAPGGGSREALLETLLAGDAAYHDGDESALPLLGVYVGGIAGYAENASISGCSTGYGTVVGSHYVGGMVGLGVNSDLGEGQSYADAVGRFYAGGITGAVCAAAKEADENGFFVPSKAPSAATLSGWTNRGAVIATEQYGGGVTGFNTGILSNCGSRTEVSAAMQRLAQRYGGDYIGGVAGYNIGSLRASSTMRVTASVSGKNYVGGIVGYNDAGTFDGASTRVSGYMLSGGYIRGENFVGGFAGLNVSAALYTDGIGKTQTISANPNLVEGKNFVGGVLGGNLLPLAEESLAISLSADNFLGRLTANAFAGGLIGYNGVADTLQNARAAAETLAEIDADTLPALVRAVDAVKLAGGGTMALTADSARLQSVTASLYAAGVLGYNAENTALHIYDAVNRTPVTATAAIAAAELSAPYGDYNENEFGAGQKTYSYTGGIVGKCTEKMVLERCRAADTGRVTAAGTYLGGLVEVNEGTLLNCWAASLGDGARNYVGGLVGLNKPAGRLEGCMLGAEGASATVIGRSMVGGLVSENFGTISGKNKQNTDERLSGAVIGQGTAVGGIAGRSVGGTVSNYALVVNVSGGGTNVGGAVGENMGAVAALAYSENGSYAVSGGENVGGILGVHAAEKPLSSLVNYASVTAERGLAGGIAGAVRAESTATGCVNFGSVQVLGASADGTAAAGGFTGAAVSLSIIECENGGDITAHRGFAGGLVGTAANSRMESGVSRAAVSGYTAAGGIAGEMDNASAMLGCIGENTDVLVDSGAEGAALGGLAGKNAGEIERGTVKSLTLNGDRADMRAGGLAGENSGTISDSRAENIRISMANETSYGYLGGAAGVNTGALTGLTLTGINVQGRAGNPQSPALFEAGKDFESDGVVLYGYGGAAGINGSDRESGATGTIENCTISGLALTVGGNTSNVALGGGVTGVNGVGSLVRSIVFSGTNSVKNERGDSYAHIGGAAGCNFGTIEKIGKARAEDFSTGSDAASEAARWASADRGTVFTLQNNIGHLGGMVGYNKPMAALRDCATGTKWTLKTTAQGQDTATGGMIGYNTSATAIERCDNWAAVSKSVGNSVAGISGRIEVTRGQWRISDCHNFGTITGARTGGVIGSLKYNGGAIERCTNYGTITNSGNPGGGIVGMIYTVSTNTEVQITSCANFGRVNSGGQIAGGILGSIGQNCHTIRVTIADCVNTGRVSGKVSEGVGGILGSMRAGSGIDNTALLIRNCRNYGVATAGMLGHAITKSSARLYVENCFGVAGVDTVGGGKPVTYPIARAKMGDSVSFTNNYYFSNGKVETSLIDIANLSTEAYATPELSGEALLGLFTDAGVQLDEGNASGFTICIPFASNAEISGLNVDYAGSFSSDRLSASAVFYLDGEQVGSKEAEISQNSYMSMTMGDRPLMVDEVRVNIKINGNDNAIELAKLALFDGAGNALDLGISGSSGAPAPDTSAWGEGTALYLKATGGSTNTYNAYAWGKPVAMLTGLTFDTSASSDAYIAFMKATGDRLRVTGATDGGNAANNLRQRTYLGAGFDAALDGNAYDSAKPRFVRTGNSYFTDNGGSVSVSWTADGTPYKYRVAVTVDGETRTYDTFEPRFRLTTTGYAGKEIAVAVCSVTPTGVESAYSDTIRYTVPSAMLPTPQIRVVLDRTVTNEASGGDYRIELLNAGDYAPFGTVRVVVSGKTSGNSNLFLDNKARSFTVVDGVVTESPTAFVPRSKTVSENYRISTYAESVSGGAARSVTLTKETMMPRASAYLSGTAIASNIQHKGFTGKTAETLAYRVSMQRASSMAVTYKNVLTAVDAEGLGVPVIYGESQVSISPEYSGTYTANISGLPDTLNDLLADGTKRYRDMTVVSYPYHMANDIVYTEKELGVFAEEELLALYVTDNGAVGGDSALIYESDGAKKLRSGYSLTLNADGTYTLSYSVLLKNATANSYTNVKKTANADGTIPTLAKPQITVDYSAEDDLYGAQIVGETAGGTYTYTLTGKTAEGASVPIDSGEKTTAGQGFTLLYSTADWAYTAVTLTVNRVGTEQNGSTTAFGSAASETTATKLKLSAIGAPAAAQNDKDNLVYTVSWSGLASSMELAALGQYEVALETTVQINGEGATKQVRALYYAQRGTDGTVPQTLEIDMDSVTGVDADGNTYTGFVPGGAEVRLSVRAMADSAQAVYTNGPAGVSAAFTLPTRLAVPDVARLAWTDATGVPVVPGVAVSIASFEQAGFKLTYPALDGNYIDKTGKLELAIEIVNGAGETVARLSTRDAPLVMDGMNLDESSTLALNSATAGLHTPFTADYSGMTLRAAARAVSDSEVSSLWSGTQDFALPFVQTDAVELNAVLSEELADIYQAGEPLTEVPPMELQQNRFDFDEGRYAKGFKAALTRVETFEGSDTHIQDQLMVTFENGMPKVLYTDGKETDPLLKTREIEPTVDGGAYTYALESRMEPIVDASGDPINEYAVELRYMLTVTIGGDGSAAYSLLLPDAVVPEMTAVGSVQKNAFTYQRIAICALAQEGGYTDSRYSVAYREAETSAEYTVDTETYLSPNGGVSP